MVAGRAHIEFGCRDGATHLAVLDQSDPLRILFPHVSGDEPATGALVTTSGGLVGGDELSIGLRGAAGTASRIVGQAAEKVYRSAGADVTIEVQLDASEGAWLEWLPQETILFEGARMRRRTRVEVGTGARLLAGESVVFGRTAMGEAMTRGLVRDAWEIRREGRLVWADALHLEDDIAADLGASAGFAGARAFASLVYVADDAGTQLAVARDLLDAAALDDDLRAAATCVGDVLVVRWLGRDGRGLRDAYGAFWSAFRHRIAGYPAAMPRLWHM
ncbi:MAG: urease accessory protein UreD [Alphaproteobacteria bacterium]|nr:urease accessory protein UreD [Alphaproteobacteria bacterium]